MMTVCVGSKDVASTIIIITFLLNDACTSHRLCACATTHTSSGLPQQVLIAPELRNDSSRGVFNTGVVFWKNQKEINRTQSPLNYTRNGSTTCTNTRTYNQS